MGYQTFTQPPELKKLLRTIFEQAIDDNWEHIAAVLRPLLVKAAQDLDIYRMNGLIRDEAERIMHECIQHHLETTFVEEIDQIAQEKARRDVEKKRKRLDLTEHAAQLELESEDAA